jgi:hypothetical protein
MRPCSEFIYINLTCVHINQLMLMQYVLAYPIVDAPVNLLKISKKDKLRGKK